MHAATPENGAPLENDPRSDQNRRNPDDQARNFGHLSQDAKPDDIVESNAGKQRQEQN
jgi:hypothetical protein